MSDNTEHLRQDLNSAYEEIDHLRAEIEECKRERDDAKVPAFDLVRERNEALADLAASQAREAKLRDALDKLARLGNGGYYGNSEGNRIAQDALALPQDYSALRDHDAALLEEAAQLAESHLCGDHSSLPREIRQLAAAKRGEKV